MEKKPTKRKLQAQETKDRIYSVALQMIEQKGYENISIEQISHKARVSVGAFYHHFSSKSDILLEIYKTGDQYFREKVVGRLSGGSTNELILSYFEHFALFYISVGVDHIKALFKTQSKIFLNKERLMLVVLSDIIEQGKAKKEITDTLSSEEIMDLLLSTPGGWPIPGVCMTVNTRFKSPCIVP